MKILYHHRIASKDGQYVHVQELTNALLQQGHQIVFVAPGVTEDSDFGSDGGLVARLKQSLPGFIYELLELAYSLVIAAKLVLAIVRDRPDFIYERYNLYQPAGVIVAKLFRLPLLLEVNAPLYAERAKYSGISLHWLAKKIEAFTWRHAAAVLPVTQVLADIIAGTGVHKDKITVIHNGIDQRLMQTVFHRPVATGASRLTIGFVGFLNQWHRIDIAIKALATIKNRDVQLLCIGDGDNNIQQELRQLAQQGGVADKVVFTGHKSREEVFDYVRQFDIALQPAVTAYASPLKMFEYMAAACLIVAPSTSNILEILSDDSALLFTEGDFDDFSRQLTCAIENIDALQQKRENAKQLIEQQGFTWQDNANRVIAIADKAISGLG